MELLGRLALLWAAILVDSWMVPFTGAQTTPGTAAPPAPRLSVFPPFHTFVRGEGVRVTCSPPGSQRAAEFLFYQMKPGGRWALQSQQKKDTWEVSTAHLEPANTFVCTYSDKTSANEPLQSALSNHLAVSVTEIPPAATLSLDPKHPVYLQGERATLTCSAPEGQEVAGYRFYKEQQDQTRGELPCKGQGPYHAFKVDRSTSGKYSCAYWMLLSEREVLSPRSSLVSVVTTERPRPPHFFAAPKREVYTSGDFIRFTCLPLDIPSVSKVTFFKGSRQLHVIPFPPSLENVTHVVRLLPQDGGKYTCSYQAVESGREILSRKSTAISISVSVPPAAASTPGSSNTVRVAPTHEITTGSTGSLGAPTRTGSKAENGNAAASAPGSSTAVRVAPTHETPASSTVALRAPTLVAVQLTSPQPATEDNLHTTEPVGPATSVPGSSQTTSHGSVSSSTDPQRSTEPFLSSSTSQAKTVSKAGNGNATPPTEGSLHLPLVAGCSGAGALFLLFLACLFRKKLKGASRRPARSCWETPEGALAERLSRISHASRTHSDFQEKAMPMWSQQVSHDWGILPKSKTVPSKRGNQEKWNTVDDDADSRAEVEFPEIDLTYTLLGYPCSTFFQAENNTSTKDAYT